jgi:hypothetical protein
MRGLTMVRSESSGATVYDLVRVISNRALVRAALRAVGCSMSRD